jgi:hypothetical protein
MNKVTYVILACHVDKGMKSFGSKGLMVFNNKKLLEHQISWIKKTKPKNAEIIVVADFDFTKIQKTFGKTINIIEPGDTNPIYSACVKAKNENLCFIDYGCLFNPKLMSTIDGFHNSTIITTDKSTDLGVGCVAIENKIEHMFFDLPQNKFCNIFYLVDKDTQKIKNDLFHQRHNLLYFEIINRLVDTGSEINQSIISHKDFVYFHNMRQKNAITRFVKKHAH